MRFIFLCLVVVLVHTSAHAITSTKAYVDSSTNALATTLRSDLAAATSKMDFVTKELAKDINGIATNAASKSNLAAVATTGSYADLTGTPTKLSEFSNDAAYVKKSVTDGITAMVAQKANAADVYSKSEVESKIAAEASARQSADAANSSDLIIHVESYDNPHGVTAAQVGAYKKSETYAKSEVYSKTETYSKAETAAAVTNVVRAVDAVTSAYVWDAAASCLYRRTMESGNLWWTPVTNVNALLPENAAVLNYLEEHKND